MALTEALRMYSFEPPDMEDVRMAADRVRPYVVRTPLLPLNAGPTGREIHIKLENLQPIGAFKVRPAANAIVKGGGKSLAAGVYTASSGNMAQGVAYVARRLGIPATVLLTRDAAATKVSSLQRLGAKIRTLDDDVWWRVLADRGCAGIPGLFVHPVADPAVVAGNATIGLEILEDFADVDTVLVPFGGGGLSTGIAAALRAAGSNARVFGVESDHCTPLAAALNAGEPVSVPAKPSFVSGIGVGTVLPEMWPLVRELLAGAVVAHEHEIVDSVRLLFERHRIIAEGAGAAPVAAALAGRAGGKRIVCVISGGNLDDRYLLDILAS